MNNIASHIKAIIFLTLLAFSFQSCDSENGVYIQLGNKAGIAEKTTASHLKSDLEKIINEPVEIITENDSYPENAQLFVLGTPSSSQTIYDLSEKQNVILTREFPGKRGGIWAKVNLNNKNQAIVLAGSDTQGMQYAVYDYCKDILHIDPFEYWSGTTPKYKQTEDLVNFQNKVISPPEIPILCYFENDVDELANIKSPKLEYDWKNYTEMINSLVRLKYNAIQLFDMLGRPEFFLRPEYKKIRPKYDIRVSYIDSMINYAHQMGMMVQIDMALGYKIKPLEQQKADCWSVYKQDWIDTWKFYFEETPLGKADIFALRPRNQVWDWEYKSACGENKIDVFNEVYAELGEIIDRYKTNAKKVVICYHDGMEMFNKGFNPPKDWIVAWSDNGWVDFDYWPESTKGYKFGTYMHAGFWLNHTIHDPCPVQIERIMKKMNDEYGANKYCMVNGQQFRPFMLNLAAFAAAANNISSFNGDAFYNDWTQYYFDHEAAPFAVNSMKKLHAAHFNKVGYVQHLWEIREAISYLSNSPIERPGKAPVSHEYRRVENDFEHVEKRMASIKGALEEAQKGYSNTGKNELFFHDYILLPVQIYHDLLSFELELHKMAKFKREYELTGNKKFLKQALDNMANAQSTLDQVYERRMTGDKNSIWNGWYNPANRRPNNGFPTHEMLNKVEQVLNQL